MVLVWRKTRGVDCGRLEFCKSCCSATSEDQPPSWTAVAPVPLCVEVQVLPDENSQRQVDCIELYLDGKLLDTRQLESKQPPVAAKHVEQFQLCPPPGRHELTARYRRNSQWSEESGPLYLDVRFPAAPEIVSVSDDQATLGPLQKDRARVITRRTFWVKLSNVSCGDTVNLYLDGRKLDSEQVEDCQAVEAAIDMPPGVYSLTARVMPKKYGHEITSRPSEQVMIRYGPGPNLDGDDEFVWGPGVASTGSASGTESGTGDAVVTEGPLIAPGGDANRQVEKVADGRDALPPKDRTQGYDKHCRFLCAARFPDPAFGSVLRPRGRPSLSRRPRWWCCPSTI